MVEASFIHRWFEEVWNNKNEDAVDQMFAVDGIGHGLDGPDGSKIVGPESFKKFHRAFVAAFPDIRVTVEDTIVEGDKIAARCKVSGTHQGDGLGLLPTNKGVEFEGISIVKVRDGKIVEAWNAFDFMKMYTQLDAVTFNQ
jgi:predicted ester cyclase